MSSKRMPGPPPRDRLRIGGLRTDAATAPAEPTPAGPAPAPVADPPRRVRSRATVVLPAPVADQLREWARETGRSHGDLILSSLIAHYGTVADQVQGSAAERAEREELGLPPLSPPKRRGPTAQLSVAMSAAGRDRLDADAGRLGMGRSELVRVLLAAAFASGDDKAHIKGGSS